MPIQFPTSPSVNQEYTYEGKVWRWDGSAWVGVRQETGIQRSNIWAKQNLLIPNRKFGLNSGYNGTTDQRRTAAGTIPALKHYIERDLGEFEYIGQQSIVTSGLVLNLDAGNPASYSGSGTVWTDLSGNGNDGTLVNSVGYTGDNSGGLVFDGVNDRGTFTSPITAASPQTYEIWTNAVASASASGGFAYLIHNNNIANTVGSSYVTIGINSSGQYFGCFNGTFNTMITGVSANLSNIVQIVLSWDNSTQILYLNGVEKDAEVLSVTPQNFSTTTSFGDDKTSTYRMIQGNIYQIRVYNRALSAAEITQNYDAMKSRYGL